jgi:hypothetical protein
MPGDELLDCDVAVIGPHSSIPVITAKWSAHAAPPASLAHW